MLELRRATPDDAAAMTDVARAAFAPYISRIGRPPAPMGVDYRAAVHEHEAWVAEDAGGIVGLLVLVVKADHLLVDIIAVRPDRQGLGVGSRLLERADASAREGGQAELRLCTNAKMTENLAFYPRHGYVRTHEGIEAGYERVYFSRTLHDPHGGRSALS